MGTWKSSSESLGITRNPGQVGFGPRKHTFQRRPRINVGSILSLPFDVLKFRANPQESPSESLGITRNPGQVGFGPRKHTFQRRPRIDVGSILSLPFDVLKFRANPQESPSESGPKPVLLGDRIAFLPGTRPPPARAPKPYI